jgi:hypothetical protein
MLQNTFRQILGPLAWLGLILLTQTGLQAQAGTSPVTVLDVRAWGAAGNGSDDTAAVAAAIGAASAVGGGVVWFPSGTYLMRTLTLPTNVILQGPDQALATIKSIGAAQIFIRVVGSNVSLRDLTVDVSGVTASGIAVETGLNGFSIIRATVTAGTGTGPTADCVTMTSNSNVLFQDATIVGCARRQLYYSLTVGTTARDLRFEHSIFDMSAATMTGFDTVEISARAGSTGSLTDVSFSDCTILFPNRGPLETDGLVIISLLTNNGFSNVTVTGGLISGDAPVGTSNGLELKGVTGVTVTGVTIENSWRALVIQEALTGNLGDMAITGNYIDCDLGHSCYSGIMIAVNGKIAVTGNVITGNFMGYGIYVGGGPTAVVGNIISGAGRGIGVAAPNTLVANNVVIAGATTGTAIVIATGGSINSTIRGNQISGQSSGYGVYVAALSSSDLVIAENVFSAVSVPYMGNYSSAGVTVVENPGAARSLTAPTIDAGCAATLATGSTLSAGAFSSGTTGTCTVVLTLKQTAINSWNCSATNQTRPPNLLAQTGGTTTTATLSGATVAGDFVRYMCGRF